MSAPLMGKQRMDTIRAELADLRRQEQARLDARLEEDAEVRLLTRAGLAVAVVIGLLGAGGIALATARRTAEPVEALARAANRVADGDYAVQVPERAVVGVAAGAPMTRATLWPAPG